MSMDYKTYVVMGIKTTRQYAKENFPDAIEEILEGEPNGIAVFQSEGSDNIVIGKLVVKSDSYAEDMIWEIDPPLKLLVASLLSDLGVKFNLSGINLYLVGVWG